MLRCPLPRRLRALALCVVIAAVAVLAHPASAQVPAERLHRLERGVNFTNWFRYPARNDDAFLRDYIDDVTLAELHRAGFGFVRLAVQPELLLDAGSQPDGNRMAILAAAIARIERHGLAVMVGWHPQTWDLEDAPAQQRQLQDLWGALAQRLRPLDMGMTFPEVLNEPVFDDHAQAWEDLQRAVLARIRAALPDATVVLTGNHWGGVDGLLAARAVADRNVVYSLHTYDPMVFTTLASFDQSLHSDALRRLPFPVAGARSCDDAAHATSDQRTADVARYYCSENWDAAKLQAMMAKVAEWSRRNHVAVIAGEFGASDRLPAATRLAWIAAMRRAFEDNGIGWALWGYDDSMGFNIHANGGTPAPLDPALLRALGMAEHG